MQNLKSCLSKLANSMGRVLSQIVTWCFDIGSSLDKAVIIIIEPVSLFPQLVTPQKKMNLTISQTAGFDVLYLLPQLLDSGGLKIDTLHVD